MKGFSKAFQEETEGFIEVMDLGIVLHYAVLVPEPRLHIAHLLPSS